MYWTYLRRELSGRKKQTIIVAAGLAIAIALVIVVNSLAAGVRDAQAQALESVYGVGTDLTVSGAMAEPGAEWRPAVPVRRDRRADRGRHHESEPVTAHDRPDAGHARRLDPRHDHRHRRCGCGIRCPESDQHDLLGRTARPRDRAATPGAAPDAGTGGADTGQPQRGFGGGNFDVNAFSVLGIDPAATAVGPLSAVTLSDGRGLDLG